MIQCHERELSADSIDPLFNIVNKKSVHYSMKSVSFDRPNPQLACGREDLLTCERGSDLMDVAPIMKTCTSICKSLREKLLVAHENESIISAATSKTVAKLLPTSKSTVRD